MAAVNRNFLGLYGQLRKKLKCALEFVSEERPGNISVTAAVILKQNGDRRRFKALPVFFLKIDLFNSFLLYFQKPELCVKNGMLETFRVS